MKFCHTAILSCQKKNKYILQFCHTDILSCLFLENEY